MEGRFREVVATKLNDAEHARPRDYTRRDVRLPQVPDRAVAVIGMRRAGKTTFLWQVVGDRVAAGTPRPGLLYFNFEDERLAGFEATDLQTLVDEYYTRNPEWRTGRRATWMLDEIQLVPGWERFVRRLLDTEHVDLFLSGSSANLLSREVATSMRGRTMEAVVYPFSFREFLRHRGREVTGRTDRLPSAARSSLQKDIREYLEVGGFPEVQTLDARDRIQLLTTHVDVTLLRDVIERYQVSSATSLRWMTRQLLANAAGDFSVHRFYQDLKSMRLPVSKDTLHDYLRYLEDAFLLRAIPVAATSERRRMVNPRKVYPIDPGLIPVFDRTARRNHGHALETVVLLALLRRGAEVTYVKNASGSEVDFLARFPDRSEQLIQVCAEIRDESTLARELRGLREAAADYPSAARHLVTLTPVAQRDVGDEVAVNAAEGWLLSEDHY
jgi:predicted AAA+ superfamily ATPase